MFNKSVIYYLLQLTALLNAIWFVGLSPDSSGTSLIILSYAIFMLIAVLSVRFAPKQFIGLPLAILLLNSCCIRFVMTEFEHSDDVYRYVWEGHIQNHGYNPYVLPPNSSELQSLVWSDFKVPNHPDLTSIYPPFSLYVFRLISFFSLDYSNYQYVFCILDILVMCLILYFLSIRGEPLQNVSYYCLNPVSIVAFSARGHLDVIMLFWLLLGLIFHYRRTWLAMWVCLALAVLSKFLVLLLIPCFVNQKNWMYLSGFITVICVAYLPFLFSDISVFNTLYIFGTQFEYNSSLFGLLNSIVQNNVASLIILFLGAGLICSWSVTIFEDPVFTGMIIATCFLLCAPTVHYWYLSFLIPFLCFYRKKSLLIWCATSGTWFIVLNSMQEGRFDHYPYYQLLQYAPVYLFMIKELYELIVKVPHYTHAASNENLSILIPVLNEEQNLGGILPQIQSQILDGDEIIIIDGGSNDKSIDIANDFGAQIVYASRGRGYQISRGMEFAKNPIVLILHADQQLEVDVLQKIRNTMSNTEIVGGCIGSVFESLKRGQWIVHALNIFRARLMRISFGDQGQFFRRSLWVEGQWELEMPLMEDVEMSILLNNVSGKICYLGGGLISSIRRWQSKNRFLNAIQIIRLVLTYCLMRRIKSKVDTTAMYKSYYGK